MVTRGLNQTAQFVIKFIPDMSQYNPAQRVQQQNRLIQQSQQQTALHAQRMAQLPTMGIASGARSTPAPHLIPGSAAAAAYQGRLNRIQQNVQAHNRQFGQPVAQPSGNWFTTPGRFSGPRRGAITALPAGPSAIAGAAFGRTAGTLTDIGVVGGLLPEGLGAGAALGGIALIGAGLAIKKFTDTAIEASKKLGTAESLELQRATFQLRKQFTLLFAEIGTVVLPVLTSFANEMTNAIRWLRENIPGLGDISGTGRAMQTLGYDARGMPTVRRNWIAPYNREESTPNPFYNQQVQERMQEMKSNIWNPEFRPRTQEAEWIKQQLVGTDEKGKPNSLFGWWTKSAKDYVYGNKQPTTTTDWPPGMAYGGIVPPRPGGTITRIGEAGQAEAVIPLSQLTRMITSGANPGMPRSLAHQQNMVDMMQDAFYHSQDLPPLDSAFEDDADAPNINVNLEDAPQLPVRTGAEYQALLDKSGWYGIAQGTGGTGPTVPTGRAFVSLTASPTRLRVGETLTLTAETSNTTGTIWLQFQAKSIATSLWSNLGSRQTEDVKTVVGAAQGTWEYRVQMWNAETGGEQIGQNSFTRNVIWTTSTVPPTPTVSLASSAATAAAGTNITLTATAQNAPSGAWYQFQQRPDGQSGWDNYLSRTQSLSRTITFSSGGTRHYRVQMWAAERGGTLPLAESSGVSVQWTTSVVARSVALATNPAGQDRKEVLTTLRLRATPTGQSGTPYYEFQQRVGLTGSWISIGGTSSNRRITQNFLSRSYASPANVYYRVRMWTEATPRIGETDAVTSNVLVVTWYSTG